MDATTAGRVVTTPARDDGARLLALVEELVAELGQREAGAPPITLDAACDSDLGIDSLVMVELLSRVERAFDVTLPDEAITAQSPGDLLRLVQSAAPARAIERGPALAAPTATGALASQHEARTLLDVLEGHVERHPERLNIVLDESGTRHEITFGALAARARGVAHALRAAGLGAGEAVALMLPTCHEYFPTFFGILMAGGIPVPVYPPARPSQIEDHLRRHVGILESAQARVLVTVPEAKKVARLLRGHVGTLQTIATPDELSGADAAGGPLPRVRPDDIALLQYTSGSTGSPKGVIVTHAALLANLRAMGEMARPEATDVFVSWLPLYHDMGLIGAWIGSIYFGFRLVLMSPLAFLSRPSRWLWAIHEHSATLTAAPNFAFALCLNKVDDADIEGLDLSSLRMIFNGAEPVSAETIGAFGERFAGYGLRADAMSPVYGLAETCLGLSFPPLGRGPLVDRVRREEFVQHGRAEPAPDDDRDPLRFVGCGHVIPGHEIRIRAETGHELPDRRQGRLEFRGPSATSGYYRNPEATAALRHGDWLDTGDLAYTAQRELFITGRAKDLIIRGGRNIHPQELEETVGSIEGVRKGCVAAFGGFDARSGTERLVVLAETREKDERARALLRQRIREASVDLIGMPADDIVLGPPHTVLKTSSGKIRRAACKELYERHALDASQRPVWLQVTRFAWAATGPRLRRLAHGAASAAYSGYAWLMVALVTVPAWFAVVLLPRRSWRRALCRLGARSLAWLCGVPIEVRGADRVPRGRCVLAVNHASYADPFVLMAALPGDAAFAAKREFAGSFFAGLALRRLGAAFVERSDLQRGVEDARALARTVREGETLVVFPEGTFTHEAGLRRFHMGAFVTAAEVGAPVVPVALQGTRTLLRADGWLLRRTPVRVTVGEPIRAESDAWNESVRLRDAARRAIVEGCGEPDLGG